MLPLRYSLGNLWIRRTRTALTVGVIGLVVLAISLFSGLVSSLERTLVTTGDPRTLVVLRKGSDNDGSSSVPLEAFQAVRFFEGVARSSDGQPLASPELVIQPFFQTNGGGRENVLVRGIEPIALEVHQSVEIVEGRMFQTSTREVIVGRGAAGRYRGATIGSTVEFGRGSWQVVGVFESAGSSLESEVWADARELAADSKRPVPYSAVRLRVAPGADRDALARRIDQDSRWALAATPESDYYQKQAESADAFFFIVVGLALLSGVGATFGATNTLYASVQSRRAEIGTLRAIGFSRASILVSFLVEAIVLALIGFGLGAVSAVVLGRAVSSWLGGISFGAATFTSNVVALRVGLGDVGFALALALAIGVLGGFFPARTAARLRPVEALRRA